GGRELALQLPPRAAALVLVARRMDRMVELRSRIHAEHPKTRIHLEACDLSDLGSIEAMLESARRSVGEADVLVNNAGLGYRRVYDKTDWERMRQVIEVNVMAPALLTHRLVPAMVARGPGGGVNVSAG